MRITFSPFTSRLRLNFMFRLTLVVGSHPYRRYVVIPGGYLEVKFGNVDGVRRSERNTQRWLILLDPYHSYARRYHAQLLGGGVREVDYPAAAAPVCNLYHNAPVVLKIGDF